MPKTIAKRIASVESQLHYAERLARETADRRAAEAHPAQGVTEAEKDARRVTGAIEQARKSLVMLKFDVVAGRVPAERKQ